MDEIGDAEWILFKDKPKGKEMTNLFKTIRNENEQVYDYLMHRVSLSDNQDLTGLQIFLPMFIYQLAKKTGIEIKKANIESVAENDEYYESIIEEKTINDQIVIKDVLDTINLTHPQSEFVEYIIFSAMKKENEKVCFDECLLLMQTVLTIFDSVIGITRQGIKSRVWSGIQYLRINEELSDYTERQTFKDEIEFEAYLKKSRGKTIDSLYAPPTNKYEAAQDVVYKAMQSRSLFKKSFLAEKAVKISKNCADAYILLALRHGIGYKKSMEYLKKAVDAGEKIMKIYSISKEEGDLWKYLRARPYMRAKAEMAGIFWKMNKRKEAEKIYYELLKISKNDNQGIRYTLLFFHAEAKEWNKLEKLLYSPEYKDDIASEWLYTKVLLKIIKGEEAGDLLREAIKLNKYVPEYLLGLKKLPKSNSEAMSFGGEDEAAYYAEDFKNIWEECPRAIEFLKKEYKTISFPKVNRNEPCPCGSGRKYKKCCGK